MGRDCGDIGDEVLGRHRSPQFLSKIGKKLRRQIVQAGVRVSPKRKDAASKRAFEMIEVWNETCKRERWSLRRGRSR